MSGGGDCDASESGRKPTLLRIKRRRGEAATDEIIVATAQPRGDPKRLRMDQMLLQLSGLGMGQVQAPAAPAEGPRRQRFRRITTVNVLTFQNKTAGEMERMVAAWSGTTQAEQDKPQPSGTDAADGYVRVPDVPETASASGLEGKLSEGAQPAGEGGEAGAGGVAAAVTPSTPRRQGPKAIPAGAGSAEHMKEVLRDMAMQRSATARYMQVRSRRHAHHAAQQQEQQERETLQSAFHIYDLVCTDVDEGAAAARAERKRQAKERAAKAAAEGAILMNYMPMVQDFLQQQGQAASLEGVRSEGSGTQSQDKPGIDADASAPSADQAQRGGAEGEEGDEDEFVYDVYLPVQQGAADDMDEDAGPSVPVVEVEDEDDLFAENAASDHDSEDSNAESYYANSYPDEDEFGPESDEDEEGWYHVQRNAPRWDDEEYDMTKDDVDAFVPHVPGESAAQKVDPRTGLGLRGAGARGSSNSKEQGEWGYRIR